MKLFKFLVGTTAVAVGACAVMGKVKKDKEKQEELDEFLCPDIETPIVKDIPVEEQEAQEETEETGTDRI